MNRLGDYLLTEEIQRTAHTALYRGRHEGTGEQVLCKMLLSEHPSPREIEKLRHEHAVTRELSIDAAPRPLRLLPHGHGLALVLADPGSLPLRARMRGERPSLAAALELGAEIAEAIDAIHERNVIHKDIQPENILVDAREVRVKITGFGLATRLSRETQAITSPGAMEGTLAYMSPEQTGRMNRAIDRRSDLYSLGVILYELLTGALPFAERDMMDLMHAILVRAPLPPRERAPEIPVVVSDLVMKLLAKAPEDRYQRALGAASDLRECLSRLASAGRIAPFPLGRHDPGNALRIPQRLYGRERELVTLKDAWRRASLGKAELLLVSGYAGIGKSQLVHEIHKEIARARGYFIAGKFEQLGRSVPYMAIAEALGRLVHLLLGEPEDALTHYRERIAAAVGQNGRVLTDLIPDLERLIGPQAPIADLPADAARNRFTMVFQDFLRVFASKEHPLVLFLDDLQWADLASLSLLKLIMSPEQRGALLVIGAYRNNEVDAAHPLSRAISEIAASATVSAIELAPLGPEDVGRFIADALSEEPSAVESLSAIVFEKTLGNPFFLIQFLSALHKDGLLAYDAARAAWRFDPGQIRARMATDNVSGFMAERIKKLPPETQRALAVGACIGHRFSLKTLSTLRDAPRGRVAKELWQALEEGILVPASGDYRFFSAAAGDDVPEEIDAVYQFTHDRVHEAAYAQEGDDQKAVIHLRLGRLLLSFGEGADLFEVAGNLNLGASLITGDAERRELASLNLTTGKRARARMAYAEAIGYLRKGASLLGDAGSEDAYELWFNLLRERAECEALSGALDAAEALQARLLARVRTPLERAQIHELGALLHLTRGRNGEAITELLSGLRVLGVPVFRAADEWKAEMERELTVVEERLRGQDIAALLDAPRMRDPDKEMVMRLLCNLDAPAIGVMPELHLFSAIKSVSLSLAHGNTAASARAYTLFGAHLAHTFRRHAEGYALCKLGAALLSKGQSSADACMINYSTAGACHYVEHWRVALGYLGKAYTAGIESGDFVFLSYACSHTAIARVLIGDPLPEVREQVDQLLSLMNRTKIKTSQAMLTVVRQLVKSLEGKTRGRASMSDDDFDEAAFVEDLIEKRFFHAYAWYCTAKGMLLYLDEDARGAASMLIRAREHQTLNFTPEIRYFAALSILANRPEDREALRAILESCMAELEAWARDAPENYLHEARLLQAERARVDGDLLGAMALYDEAIAAAERSELPSGVALASELAAKLYLAQGRVRVARAYMTDACYAYARWGATAKVRRLGELYPDLVPVETLTPAHAARAARGEATTDLLDLDAFMRIQEALSGDLVLHKVLDRLMRTALLDAGAERGSLLLMRDGALLIEATATAEPLSVSVGMGKSFEEGAALPVTIVRYVERLREMVVLDDAPSDSRFCGDPYIVARQPRSIACLPLSHQGRVIGVLYLESHATAGAFTAGRLSFLRLLLSQAGISIENAELYARLHALSEEQRRANEALEVLVSKRTEELVRVQAGRLAELSAPVIPITSGILVMPLIGTVDDARAAQILDAALHGVHARRARVMIFDVTGMKGSDMGVASALLRAANALSLIGAEAVITGIDPGAARLFVELGVDLSAIATRGTLEDGIVYALSRTGQRWVRGPSAAT